MTKKGLVLLAILSTGSACCGADPVASIFGPKRVALEPIDPDNPTAERTAPPFLLLSTGSVSDEPLEWFYMPNKTFELQPFFDAKGRPTAVAVAGLRKGSHEFALIAKGKTKPDDPNERLRSDVSTLFVEVVDPVPVKIPPVPVVDPTVPPVVDPPAPPAPPVPIPTPSPQSLIGRMRVLIVHETQQKYTPQQLGAINSTAVVRPYLSTHTEKDGASRPYWRVWDKDVKPNGEEAWWTAAIKRANEDASPLPKVCIFTKDGLVASETFAGIEDAMSFLKKYGGD
jgi:hypothetical protein